MRVSREEMDRSHERIVEAAARLFREQGVENTSVAGVMAEAGLTHGGFYRHFDTKDSLIAAALEQAFEQVHELIEADGHDRAPAEARARYHGYYLSEAHLGRPGAACPVATLAGDVARAEPALKDAFGRGVNRMLDALEQQHPGGRKERRMAATREFAMLVGAALIARASDPETAERVLAACRPLSG